MALAPKRLLAGAAVVLAAIGLLGPVATAAPRVGSATSSTAPPVDPAAVLAYTKTKAAAAVSVRNRALQAAVAAVKANPALAATDRATLQSALSTQSAALSALGATVQADPTVLRADADYTAIFLNLRVFALVLPQVRLAAAADDLTGAVIPRLSDAQARLGALLSGIDAAKDSAPVKAAQADLAKQISAATAATSGVANRVLAYHPADWNGDHAILDASRAALVTARVAATAARPDISTIVAALA